jgi:hypothetical protein
MAVAIKQETQRRRCCWVVHANDPLGPGEVLDPLAEVYELPIEEGDRSSRYLAEQDVLGAEVPVNKHFSVALDACNALRIYALQCAEEHAALAKNPIRLACTNQVLAVGAFNERRGDLLGGPPDYLWDWDAICK